MLQREVELIQSLEPRHNKNSTNRCKSGRHRMTPENTYVQPGGGRTCKECRTERWAARPKEKRQQYVKASEPSRAAWRKAHPEARTRAAARKRSPEVRARSADVQREYRNRPEVRERLNAQQRERRQRPAVQEKLREYARKPEYRSRPGDLAPRGRLQGEQRDLAGFMTRCG
jgi:hypothetical protein